MCHSAHTLLALIVQMRHDLHRHTSANAFFSAHTTVKSMALDRLTGDDLHRHTSANVFSMHIHAGGEPQMNASTVAHWFVQLQNH